MGIPCYLAMTAAEMGDFSAVPEHMAWMGCQFSSWNAGLSNLPQWLPPGAVLTLNDSFPLAGHDPERIAGELRGAVEAFSCAALVLDFQRPGDPETEALAARLTELPCPVAVSLPYAREDLAVLLPPAPLSVPLEEYLSPWRDRDIWLELALDGEIITLTEEGAQGIPLPYPDRAAEGFREEALHCHYRAELKKDRAEFTLWRTVEDLHDLTEEAEKLGVKALMGLYQELYTLQT